VEEREAIGEKDDNAKKKDSEDRRAGVRVQAMNK